MVNKENYYRNYKGRTKWLSLISSHFAKRFTKLSFCQKLIFWHQTSSHKCSMCLYCVSKLSDCFSKSCGTSWFTRTCTMHITKCIKNYKGQWLTELAHSPFYSDTNVHLVATNAFVKSDEIPSLPVQDIKENPRCRGQRITKDNNSNIIGP